MRTDSTSLSEQALDAARQAALELYGRGYVPSSPRRYEKRVKNAQEAHEAVRPSGERFKHPDQSGLSGDHLRLYDLIWKRTVASQMGDAEGLSVQVRLGALSSSGEDAEFAANGRVVNFPGFLRAYVEGSDDPEAELEDKEVRLPRLARGDSLVAEELQAEGHTTQPPARYTEASLVKALEEMGVGRPSTYATILDTIQQRGYSWKKGSALVPSWTAFAVVGLLEQHFAKLVDYGFTAEMEEDLDDIARGDQESLPWLTRFYFGTPSPNGSGGRRGAAGRAAKAKAARAAGPGPDGADASGLKQMVAERLGEIDARAVNSIPVGGPGSGVVVRVGRFGPYLQDTEGEKRASLPEDLAPDELTLERARELLDAPALERAERELGTDPGSGLPVYVREGRYGPYVQLGTEAQVAGAQAGGAKTPSSGRAAKSKAAQKPKRSSLLSGMSPDEVTLEEALRLLSLPRTVGQDPTNGEEIVADNGRYGPYVRRGSEYRSLESEEQLFTVSLDDAVELFSKPRARRTRQAAAPLAELGDDPVSGAPVVVKEGRFGPYVTDGTVNASLQRGDSVEGLTLERAAELLAQRRARVAADAEVGVPSTRRKSAAGGRRRATTTRSPGPAKRTKRT